MSGLLYEIQNRGDQWAVVRYSQTDWPSNEVKWFDNEEEATEWAKEGHSSDRK